MENLIKGNQASLLMWAIIATLLSQKLAITVLSIATFQDQKNFSHFPPNPYTRHIPPISSIPTIGISPPTGSAPCSNFWKNHPQYIVSIFGWSGTLGKAFGIESLSGFGPHTSILDLLSNNHKDGFGSLCREGTASLLNSMVNMNFPYSTTQVRDHFLASLSSEKVAA